MIAGALVAAFLAVGISGGSHFDSDDTLYAQMAREMVETGDYLDNRWSDVVQFEKPPLYLWTLAAAGAAGDWSEGALRIPGTLFAAGAVMALFLLAVGLGATRLQAWLASGLLGTSFLFLVLARRLMTDLPMLACALGAAAALVHGRKLWFGVLCGLAVLAKGAGAGPPLIALAVFALWQKHLTLRELVLATGVGVLVAAPWHLIETARHGSDFWSGYIGYHVGERATSNVVPGLTRTDLLGVLLEERILLGLALAGLAFAARDRFRSPLARFAVLWLVFVALPPMLTTTRLPHYLLPVVPALALLATAIPLPRKYGAWLAAAAVFLAFAIHPAKPVFWLDPDFAPADKVLGQLIAESATDDDIVCTWNATSSALTFYTGGRRIWIVGADPVFHAVQEAVLAIDRSALLRSDLPPLGPAARRFVMTRPADVPSVAGALAAQSRRPLSRVALDSRVLVNDAGLGDPLPP